jgi:AcrR family transcriptional regulator
MVVGDLSSLDPDDSDPSPLTADSGGSRSKRDAILDVAAQSFAKQGFHGVSMRDIAKANNSSVATLYNHFTSKDALFLATCQRFFTLFLPHLEEIVAGRQDGLTRLLAMVEQTFADGCVYRYEFLSLSHDRRHVGTAPDLLPLVSERNRCVQLWHRVLDEGMRDGSIRGDLDTDSIVWIVFSSVTGILDDNLFDEFAGSVLPDPLKALVSLLRHGLTVH